MGPGWRQASSDPCGTRVEPGLVRPVWETHPGVGMRVLPCCARLTSHSWHTCSPDDNSIERSRVPCIGGVTQVNLRSVWNHSELFILITPDFASSVRGVWRRERRSAHGDPEGPNDTMDTPGSTHGECSCVLLSVVFMYFTVSGVHVFYCPWCSADCSPHNWL